MAVYVEGPRAVSFGMRRERCAVGPHSSDDPQWARNAIAECRRVGAAPFLKQWGTYKNNPCVVEDGLTEQQAMKIDPPDNGKGGGKLDGSLWREFPNSSFKMILATASRGRGAEDGSERPRAVYPG
jgi:hypothetical protein